MEPKPPVKPTVIQVEPPSPRYTTQTGSPRKIAIPVDLSDESAYAVQWAVQNYLRPGDAVTLIHVRPTSVLYGADWGSTHFTTAAPESGTGTGTGTETETETETEEERKAKTKKIEDDFDQLTSDKLTEVAKPLSESKIGYKVHVVKDHDMKERLCLEIERLGMSVVIMGSKGFGASRKRNDHGRLGSVSDYCVHHCVCPVVVVRYPNADGDGDDGDGDGLVPVPEEEVPVAQVDNLHLHAD